MTSELPAASPSPDAGRAVRHALGWMVVSCMLFAIVMVAVRMLLHDLPPTQTAFLRYVVGIGLLMPFVGRQIPQIWRSPARGGSSRAASFTPLPSASGSIRSRSSRLPM